MKRILAFPRLGGCQLTGEEDRLFLYLLDDQAQRSLIKVVVWLTDMQRGVSFNQQFVASICHWQAGRD